MNDITELMLSVITKANKPAPGDIEEMVGALFPSLYVVLATIGAFLVTLIILSKFFYKPVKKMMKKRHDFIQSNIDDSILAKDESLKNQSKSKEELTNSKFLAQEIVSKSKKESEVLKLHYIDEGKKEAERLINEANVEINFKLAKIEETRANDIIDAAIIISKQVISKNIDKNKMEEYFDSYIKGE